MAIDLGTSPTPPDANPTASEALQINLAINAAVQRNGTGIDHSIIGGSLDGDARGAYAVDIQADRFTPERVAGGEYSCAIGNSNNSTGSYSSAIGYGNIALNTQSNAIGKGNTASGDYSSAFGTNNTTNGDYSSAFGYSNTASGARSAAFGGLNQASGSFAYAAGYECIAGPSALAIGFSCESRTLESSAIGCNVRTDSAYSQEFGYWSDSETRQSSIRIHGDASDGHVSISVPQVDTFLTDGGEIAGLESNGTLMRKAIAFQIDSANQLICQYNNASGVITSINLGVLA